MPYGRKPPEMVIEFARGIAEFLCGLGVEGLVVACNTASAVALPALGERCAVPVWGVIDPGVEAAARATRSGSVGVAGTKGTIGSGAYQRRLEARGMKVWARACPMLVHVVEEGLADSEEAEILTRHYLEGRPEIDTLILGCTHYPLLRSVFQRVAGDRRNACGQRRSNGGDGQPNIRRPAVGPGSRQGDALRDGGPACLRAYRERDRRRGWRSDFAAGDGVGGSGLGRNPKLRALYQGTT